MEKWFDYNGESLDDLIALGPEWRVDSRVAAVHQALSGRRVPPTHAELVVVYVNEFENGINGGGLQDYLWNSKGQALGQLPDMLREIGAPEVASLLERGMAVADLVPPCDPDEVEEAMDEPKKAVSDALSALDQEYFAAGIALSDRLWAYVVAHRDEISLAR